MKRGLVFMLLGPALGVLLFFYLVGEGYRDVEGVPIVFAFLFVVSAITGLVDGVLTYVVPIWVRAPVIAIAGAAVAVGFYLFLIGTMRPLDKLVLVAVIGASSTGVSSLLSHNYRRAKA